MATFTPSALIGSISGNLGGINFVRGKHRAYMRKRLQRIHKTSPLQLERRARLAQILRTWSTMDQSFRDSWNALGRVFPVPLAPARPRYVSGFQNFLAYNLYQREETEVWTQVPPNAGRVAALTGVELHASAAGAIDVSWNVPVNYRICYWFFYGSRSLSSKPKFHFKNYRYVGREFVNLFTNHTHLRNAWDAALGPPLEGERIGLRVIGGAPANFASFPIHAQTTTTP